MKNHLRIKNINVEHLRNKHTANVYRAEIERNIENINEETNQNHWKSICDICINSSEKFKPPRIKPGIAYNEEINILSNHQINLRLRIEKEKNEEKVKLLKATRNKALHSIRNIQEKENENKLNVVLDEINNSKNDSRRMFQAVKAINRNNDSNITVQDKNGNYIGNTKGKIEVITDHFKSVFQNENAIGLPRVTPKTLNTPFTDEEVKKAVKSLKNDKSACCDLLRAEHLKYAPDSICSIHEHIAEFLNNVVKTGEYPKEIKNGIFSTIAKPWKEKRTTQKSKTNYSTVNTENNSSNMHN